jgi:chorismate dehydratase
VQYLNATPLIAPYDGTVSFQHPAALADQLAAGEIDVGLVPIYEALRHPHFPIADGVSIASRGPVYSVFMAYRGALAEIEAVTPDPASRTSNNFLRCLLAEYHNLHPVFDPSAEGIGEHRGQLLIGNQAICFRRHMNEEIQIYDLGEEWQARTGLPFVYAAWQIRPEIPNPAAVAEALRAIKVAGTSRIREIARLQRHFDPTFAEHYLTTHVKFDLGPEEKSGLQHFHALLVKHGLLAEGAGLRFV